MSFKSTVLATATVLLFAAPAATPSMAQGLLKMNRLSATLAQDIVTTAVETCTKQGQFVSAIVLDIAGVQQAFLRGDGAGIHTVVTADYKAYTSLSFKLDGVDMVKLWATRPPPSAIPKLPRLLLAQGGVLIKAGDEVIGVVAVSGARGMDLDTTCARAGIDKIKDQLK